MVEKETNDPPTHPSPSYHPPPSDGPLCGFQICLLLPEMSCCNWHSLVTMLRNWNGYKTAEMEKIKGSTGDVMTTRPLQQIPPIIMKSKDEVRAKKPSLTQPGDQRLKGNFQTTANGRAGGLLARTGSLSGHSYKKQPCSTLLDSVISR
ncbi:hypothetical protein J6590_095082 [Homalodisca vitripennis]|nr:hypothetical protein J6590_095082 [Homalodisca vitripennis]